MEYLILTDGLKKGHILRCSEGQRDIYVWGLNQYNPLDSETEWEYFYHGDGDLVGEYIVISEEAANELIERNGQDIETMLNYAKNLAEELNVTIPLLSEDSFDNIIVIVSECLKSPLCTEFILEGLFSDRVIHAAKVRYNN